MDFKNTRTAFRYLTIGGFVLTVCFAFLSCRSVSHAGNTYSFEPECLGVAMDGSLTLKVMGIGRNRKDAVNQAKKAAIRDVLFKGIYAGSPECERRPVLPIVNIQKSREDYFNAFFSENGDYLQFAAVDKRWKYRGSATGSKGDGRGYSCIVAICVHKSLLRQKMVEEGLLHK
jgi:hypothetical protein